MNFFKPEDFDELFRIAPSMRQEKAAEIANKKLAQLLSDTYNAFQDITDSGVVSCVSCRSHERTAKSWLKFYGELYE